MSECASGNEINAGFGNGADGREIDAAAGFGFCPAFALLNGEPQLDQVHVVQQDEIRTRRNRLIYLFECVGFDFHFDLRVFCARGADGGGDCIWLGIAQSGEMIVFDEHHVEQAEAVINAAAASDGIFFQSTQAGSGFARVKNLRVGALDGIHELRSQGGDAGEALNEIEGDAFGAQDGTRIAGNAQQVLAGFGVVAIAGERFNQNARRKLTERRFRESKPCDNENFPRAHYHDEGRIFRHGRERGHIATADVFGERELYGAADFFRIERLHA